MNSLDHLRRFVAQSLTALCLAHALFLAFICALIGADAVGALLPAVPTGIMLTNGED